MLVCEWTKLHLLGDPHNWVVKGFVAVNRGLLSDLAEIDAKLRENDIDSLKKIEERLGTLRQRVKTNPVYYRKKNMTDDWKKGKQKIERQDYDTEGGVLEYTFVWLVIFGSILGGKACLATIAAAMRYGFATLHPFTPGLEYMFMELEDDLFTPASYTLSGFLEIW
jgi:hypothetical protein